MDRLSQDMKALAITSFGEPGQGGVQLAQRPDAGGKLGREIQLCANLYKIKFSESPSIAHYDVTITPVRDKDTATRSGGAPPPGGGTINREVTNAIWDALVKSNPEGLGAQLNKAGFDCRKNAFSLGKLFANGSKTFQVELDPETPNRPARRFEVKLQLAQLLDLSILEKFCQHKQAANLADSAATAIMALDVLLRHSNFRQSKFVIGGAGRRFLDTSQSTQLGEGAHVLAGLFQSVRPTTSGMAVNLDTSYSPFIVTGKLRDVCNAIVGRAQAGAAPAGRGGRGGFRGGRGGGRGGFGGAGGRPDAGPYDQRELHELKKKLVGAKVRVTHREDKRPFIIKGFGQLAGQHRVTIDDKKARKAAGSKPTPKEVAEAAAKGQKIPLGKPAAAGPSQSLTVAEYFKKTYNKTVDPNIQVVELRGGQFVPIECLELLHGCAIPPTKLSANQATNMINIAAKPPAERRAAIEAIRRDADFGPSSRPAAWGLQVDPQMMRSKGRVLPPPKVQYQPGPKSTPSVAFGAWNLRDVKFLQPGKPLEHWAIAVFADKRDVPEQALFAFFDAFVKQARLRGMVIRNNHKGFEYQQGAEDPLQTLKRTCNRVLVQNPLNPKQQPPQVIFCVLKDTKRYDSIKRSAAFDLPVAVPTQVLTARKVMDQRGVDQYQGNCLLKLNAKLGGVNSTVTPFDVPAFKLGKTLILGADVTHPTGFGTARAGSGENVPSSIAAVVGSTDAQGMKYGAQVREQEGRREFITGMEEMVVIHVRAWMKENKNVKPDTVLMFRDGVSEGQYAPVVQEEVTALKAAFRVIDPKWTPKLTYVVCAKRHNIRLFPANPTGQDVDRTGNLPPGVVVDTSITHPYAFDFYLQAHAGLKGTAKPTRYIVLLDENRFGSDGLQKTINSLCYGYARATRSVSLVPAAYYADIVAGKARSYVTDDDASTTASGVGRARARDPTFIQKQLDREFKGNPGAMGTTMWFV
ncbi:hypothetical protein JCM11251_002359 [Rhodosporidiobolus azoricus]